MTTPKPNPAVIQKGLKRDKRWEAVLAKYPPSGPNSSIPAASAPATPAGAAVLTPEQEAKANRVIVKQYEDSWGRINQRFIAITPMGTMANAEGMTTQSKSYALQNAYNTTLNAFAEIVGDEYLGAYIMAQGLNDTQQRQATLQALLTITDNGVTALPQVSPGGIPVRYANGASDRMTPELFGQVVQDPSKFKDLNVAQQTEFIAQAEKVIDEQRKHGNQAESIQRAMAAVATGDMTNVLSDAEVSTLHTVVSTLRRGEADEVRIPGVVEMSGGLASATPGTEDATFVFDAEWAKAHPAKAAAEAYYLQQRFPNATVKYGDGGIASDIFNALGKPIDVIATPFSTLITQSTRSVRHIFDHGDVPELQSELKRQQEQLLHAPLAERGAIMNTIDNLRDRIGVITGESLGGEATRSLMDRSLNSEEVNLGFARNIVEGTGLLPGDGGYNVAVGATMIAGSVFFDPLTYLTGGLAGAKAARTIPKVAGAAGESAYTTRSLVARWVYNRMALNPEQFLEKTGAADTLAAIAGVADAEQYAMYLQDKIRDPFMVSNLIQAGDNPESVKAVLISFMSGPVEGTNLPLLATRRSELAKRLNQFEAMEVESAHMRTLSKGSSELAGVEEEIMRLDEAGQAAGPEFDALVARRAELEPAVLPRGTGADPMYPVAMEGAVAPELKTSQLNKLVKLTDETGGATMDPSTGKFASIGKDSGFPLGAVPSNDVLYIEPAVWANARQRNKLIRDYVASHPELSNGDVHLGFWKDPAGIVNVTPTQIFADEAEALALGSARGEKFAFNLLTGEDVPVPKGGMNLVDEAIGSVPLETTEGIAELERSFIPSENIRFHAEVDAGNVEKVRDYGNGSVWKSTDYPDDLERTTRYWYVENDEVRGFRSVDMHGEVGTVTAEGYEGKGIARVLHDSHWDDLGIADDPAKMAAEIRKQSSLSPGGAALNHSAARDRLNGLNGVGTQLDQLRATQLSDKAELAKVTSLMKGRSDDVMPMDFSELRSLQKSGDKWLGAVGRSMDDLGEFPRGRDLPPLYNPSAKRILNGLRVAFETSGTEGANAVRGYLSRAIWLPGVNLPEEAMANALRRSYDALVSVGHVLKVDDATIARWMSQWSDLAAAGDRHASYKWFTGYWDALLEASPAISAEGKSNLYKLWNTSFDQFGSDFIRTSKAGEFADNEPLMYKVITDPTGAKIKAPQPVFTADALSHGVFLPSLDQILKVMHPGATKYLVGDKATKVTSIWKRAILLGKMPFALPMRIVGELSLARMSAYDLAGVSPFGILDYLRSAFGKGKFAEYKDLDEAFALGNILEDFTEEGGVFNRLSGMGLLKFGPDGDNWFRALSGRLEAIIKSPETRYIMRASTPQEFIGMVNDPAASAALRHAAEHWSQMEGGLDVNAARAWKYLHTDLVGSGEFAEDMGRLLGGGKLSDGTQAGTLAFSNKMKAEVAAGRWIPGVTEVHAKYGQGLYAGRTTQVARSKVGDAVQAAFRQFYGRPEAAMGRVPAFRQLATKYQRRLVNMGYDSERAHRIASAAAQEDVASMFFKIGAHTSGEYMVQNLSPFFPAYREVTSTWLLKLPQRISGGNWPVGAAYLTQRGRVLLDGLTEMGVIEEGPDGRKRIHIPFLSPALGSLVSAVMPGSQDYGDYDFSFTSMFGLLPVPGLDAKTWTEALTPMMPGLGGAWGLSAQVAGTAMLDRTNPGLEKDLADLLAPYGVGDIGGNWSRLYTSLALLGGLSPESAVPPWERLAHSDYREMMIHSSIDNAMRELVASGAPEYQPPEWGKVDWKDPAAVKAFMKQYTEFQSRLLEDSEHLAGAKYMQKSILSMFLPVSGTMSTEEQDSITAIWGMVYGDGLPEDVAAELRNPLVDSFNAAYPYADWWTIGKSKANSKRGVMDENLSDDMEALFSAGLRSIRSPEEYSVWAMGMGSYARYRSERTALYAQYADNPVDYLFNGSEVRDEITALDGQFNAYLEFTDQWAKSQNIEHSFKDMLGDAQDDWFPHKRYDIQGLAARELTQTLTLVQGAVEEGTYSDIRRDLFALIDSEKEQAARTGDGVTMWDSIGKYYDKVADPYYQHLDKMYDRINALPEEHPSVPGLYADIREYTSRQKPKTVNGIEFPTPEEVAFSTKTPEEQRAKVVDWLSNDHPEWLTTFQQEQTGMTGGKPVKQVDKLTGYLAESNARFAEQWPHTYMTGKEDAQERLDAQQAAYARSIGMGDVYALWQRPMYAKLDAALDPRESGPGWRTAVGMANETMQSLNRADLNLWSQSTSALPTQRWLMNRLTTLYKSDPNLRAIVDNAAIGLADDPEQPVSRQDVLWRIFFNGYGPAPVGLL